LQSHYNPLTHHLPVPFLLQNLVHFLLNFLSNFSSSFAPNFKFPILDKERLLKRDTLASRLFADINKFNETTVDCRIYCCDGLCVASAVDPSIVTESHVAYGEVMVEGKKTSGAIFFNMYPDFVDDHADTKNVTQMNNIDHDKYISMLATAIGLEDYKIE
jgi:hypothetical protein